MILKNVFITPLKDFWFCNVNPEGISIPKRWVFKTSSMDGGSSFFKTSKQGKNQVSKHGLLYLNSAPL